MNLSNNQAAFLSFTEEKTAIKNGTVVAVSSNAAIVTISNQQVRATRAVSCFIEPVPEDRVICCRDEEGQWYILGIIQREKTKNMEMAFPADMTMKSQEGSITILTSDNMNIVSKNLHLFSEKAMHKSKEATISFDEVTAKGEKLQACYKTVNLISNLITTLARQVLERFKGYSRKTEGAEQIKAGQATKSVAGLCSLDSKYTIMVSKESTKIDGEKILMG